MSTAIADLHEAPAEPRVNYLNASYGIKSWLLTFDHKRIGLLYLGTITLMFMVGGIAATLMRLHRRVERFRNGERRENACHLKCAGDAAADNLGSRQPDEIGPVQYNAALIGPKRAANQVEQRRLAGSVWANHGGQRAGWEFKRYIANGGNAFERL